MKRVIALLLSVLLTAAFFAGCGTDSTNKEQASSSQASSTQDTDKAASTAPAEKKISGKITVSTNSTDKVDTVLKDLTKQFMDENPDTQVDFQAYAGSTAKQTLKVKMASAALDDITLVLPDVKTVDFQKYFVPIDDVGFTKDNIYFYQNGLGPDGKLYKIDGLMYYSGMVYNKKVFADCGIEQTPRTLDELYAACDKIKAKGITPIASNFKDKWPLGFWHESSYVQSNTGNANYLNDLVGKNDILTDDGGFLAGLKFLRTMKDKGYLENDLMSTSWDGFSKDFPQGKFAMAYIGSWYPPQFVEKGGNLEDVGMFPIPETKCLLVSYDWFYAVAANSQNVDLAKAFMKWAFLDPKYIIACNQISAVKSQKASQPFIDELLSSNLPVIESVAKSDDYNSIITKSQIDTGNLLQEYVIAQNPDDVVKKYNKMWADAKKALDK